MDRSQRQTRARFRRIGLELKRLRQEAGMDLTEAARFLRRSTASLCRIENGSMIRERDLEYILDKYGVQDPLRSALLELSIKGAERGWWHRHTKAATPELMDFISLEQDARTIRNRQTDLIPGLLQTEDYARSLMETTVYPPDVPLNISAAVDLRMKRQELLVRFDAPKLKALVNEGALHQQIGGIPVMRAQMRALLKVMELPHVEFRVLPYGTVHFPGIFTLMEIGVRGRLPIAMTESCTKMIYIEDPAEITPLEDVFDRLWGAALNKDDTRNLLDRLSSVL